MSKVSNETRINTVELLPLLKLSGQISTITTDWAPGLSVSGESLCLQGEVLRNLTFDQNTDPENDSDYSFGCYTTYDVRPWVTELDKTALRELWHEMYPRDDRQSIDFMTEAGHAYEFETFDCRVTAYYYWDGDGFLAFRVTDISTGETKHWICNSDCKKTYKWEDAAEYSRQS